MTRRAGQLLALIVIAVLVTVAVWYQSRQDAQLRTSVLSNYGYYGTQPGSPGSTPSPTRAPEDFDPHRPQMSTQEGTVMVLTYLVPFDELVILDALQVTTHVPSFTTPVRWAAADDNYEQVVIDDDEATRTAFIAPDQEGTLSFTLAAGNASGQYLEVARYEFMVMSPLSYTADVNKDGVYDFQNDLVNLLRNWDSFGEDATRTLALILSRLDEDDDGSSTP